MFVDAGESATTKSSLLERAGGTALVNALKRGDHVIATTPHRLFRNLQQMVLQMSEWDKMGVYMHFADMDIRTDTPNGKLVLHILGSIAEWKAAMISARQKEGAAWRKKNKVKRKTPLNNELKTIGAAEQKACVAKAASGLAHIAVDMIERRMNPAPRVLEGVVRAYIRVSTDKQSAASQLATIKNWVKNSLPPGTPVEVYDDSGFSAYTNVLKKREGGKRLLADLQKGDYVVAIRQDRLCRSIKDMSDVVDMIEAKGATTVMLDCGLRTDTPFGRIMVKMLGFAAEIESHEVGVSSNSVVASRIMERGHVTENEMPIALVYENRRKLRIVATQDVVTEEEWKELWKRIVRKMKNRPDEEAVHALGEVQRQFFREKGWPPLRISVCKGAPGTRLRTIAEWIEVLEKIKDRNESQERLLAAVKKADPASSWSGLIQRRFFKSRWKRLKKWLAYVTPGSGFELDPTIQGTLSGLETLREIAGV